MPGVRGTDGTNGTGNGKRVLFDASWLGYRAKYTTGKLSHRGERTGIVFGFLNEILSACENKWVRSNRVGIFFDGPKQFCVRRAVLPGYKSGRNKKPPTPEDQIESAEFYRQMKDLRKTILPALGFPVYRAIGFEADDLIADAAGQTDRAADSGVIISGDSDLWQAVTDSVHWYDVVRDYYVDPGRLWADARVSPKDWGRVKCLAGCDTDDVPGIPGVGEKTATDYIWGLLKEGSKKLAAVREREREVTTRNAKVVLLPHARTPPVKLREPEYDADAFATLAERMGFASHLNGPMAPRWAAFFAGKLANPTDAQAALTRKAAR